jgi:hypothetical protein
MDAEKGKCLTANIGGISVDFNAGMIEAVTNPPCGFVSKHRYDETDVEARLRAIEWFANCGMPVTLYLTMPFHQLSCWDEAIECCTSVEWKNSQLEAQNQLTLWLHLHDREHYQDWNESVREHKKKTLDPLIEQVIDPLLAKSVSEPATVIPSVQWDVLGALMENSYLSSGHAAFFFPELLTVYEAGHFPCGWRGCWPEGELLIL